MIMRSMAVISVIAVGTLMAASPAPAATEALIEITEQGFTPDSIEIAAGDVVEWRNTDQEAHTVTAENGSFDSGPLEPGASFSLTFEAAGSYTYTSTGEGEGAWIATVVVREAPDVEQPPTEDPPDETVIDPDASPPPVDVPEQPPTEPPGVEEADPSAVDGSPSPTIQPRTVASAEAAPASPLAAQSSVSVAQSGPTVTIVDNAYQPREVEVSPGTTVLWQQEGELPHTVTADDGSFDSGEMGQGDTYSRAFPQAGTFPYYCRFHGGPGGAGMAGVVIVSGGDAGGGPSGGGDGSGAADTTEGDTTTGDTLAETGGPVLPAAIAMTGFLVVGTACLAIDRRRQRPSRRGSGFERHRLVPSARLQG